MKTVLLYSAYTDQMSYFDDWIDAFKDHNDYKADCLNVYGIKNVKNIAQKIETAELVIIHHSMNGDTLAYLKPFVSVLQNRTGKLVSFVGNEVNLPILGMRPKIQLLQSIKPDIIATQLLQEAGEWLYKDCTSKVVSLPHALNPKAFSPSILTHRPIDIGTRSARYNVYIGDNDRNAICEFFHKNAAALGVHVDLGLETGAIKRFNRSQWAAFLAQCTATLSTEAGSFYLEKDDSLITAISQFLRTKSKPMTLSQDSVLRQFYRSVVPLKIRQGIRALLGQRLTDFHDLDFNIYTDEIQEKFFSCAQKCPVYSKAVSSRHFDAIGTKTLHIMYPGRYNDILKPGIHYFELQKDHSNTTELIEILRDKAAVQRIVDRAYSDIINHHTHTHRLDTLLTTLQQY